MPRVVARRGYVGAVSVNTASVRVLLVEDESLLAMLIEDMVTEVGATVVSTFDRLAPAMDFARDQPGAFDLAIMDMNLAGERAEPLADLLHAAGTPFVLSTGYGAGASRWPNAPILSKPFELGQLKAAIGAAMAASPA